MAETVAKDKAHAQAQIENAVAAQNKALSALTQETESSIKKTNKSLTAQVDIMIKNNDKVRDEMKADTAALKASLEAARKSADAQLAAVDAASAARYDEVVKAVEDGIETAREKADARFSGVYDTMLEDRKKFEEKLGSNVAALNDAIAKNSAIQDARFAKTVKDIAAARKEAAAQVAQARKDMSASIFATTAKAKDLESRIIGDLQVVSAMVVSDKAAQIKINNKVDAELSRVLKKSNDYESTNKNRRGVIRKMIEEYKQAAAQETAELAKESRADVKKLRSEQAASLLQFKQDLTEATEHVYDKLAKDNAAQEAALSGMKADLASATAASAASLKESKEVFESRVEALNGAIVANAKHFEARFSETTGVVNNWKEAADADRENIRVMRDGMVADLNKNIARAIELGEAKIKAAVENMADNVFKVSQENRQKIADNYLSLKAYAATAADLIADYLQKGKGRNLSSVGDLLNTVAAASDVKTAPAQGMGFGGDSLPLIFSGETIKVDNAVSKINGLVNEYIDTIGQVKERWPLGLGHYLIAKLEIAMTKAGALEVDKIEGKSGNYVFMNAHSVGLSSKLSDFEGLAGRMAAYEHTLASLTGKLPKSKTAGEEETKVPPPEWEGN